MFTAPQGYSFAVACGDFRKEKRNDTALIVSDVPAAVAGVFTQNLFPAAPVLISKKYIQSGLAKAILINSGQANACTGQQGLDNCQTTTKWLAQAINCQAEQVLPASTGVIGAQMDMDKWHIVIPKLMENLGKNSPEDFAKAIMTTDAFPKMAEQSVELSTGKVHILGMAKGAGMICPNMATMLCSILCDVKIETASWQKMLSKATEDSFNRVTVDGDTSTNDTVFALANGASQISLNGLADEEKLYQALVTVMQNLAYMLVQDGEGASKVAHIQVSGAATKAQAEQLARTVGHSPLVKTALYGQDANWGRFIMAIGRAGVNFNPDEVSISLCGVELFKNGQPTNIDADNLLKEPLSQRDLYLDITIGTGNGSYLLLASDLTHAYIDCNASYRS